MRELWLEIKSLIPRTKEYRYVCNLHLLAIWDLEKKQLEHYVDIAIINAEVELHRQIVERVKGKK